MKLDNIKKIKITKIITVLGSILLCGIFATTAWATLSMVKSQDAAGQIAQPATSEIPAQLPYDNQSRAPEPTTLALFGSGLVGMLIRFIQKAYARVKRMLDFIGSIAAIIILSPLFLATAIAVKLTSKGSIFFKQERVGKNGKPFRVYKFRTMCANAEKETGPVWARENDIRITPIGKFLRKSHIDEIPQFVNVLRGEMSIIGPRPERQVFVDKLKDQIQHYEGRLKVKPGITGLAQVWHRYDETIEDVKKKIRYDLLYIRKMCLWTDVMIILRTFRVVLTGEGSR